jgi:hypothetical protein
VEPEQECKQDYEQASRAAEAAIKQTPAAGFRRPRVSHLGFLRKFIFGRIGGGNGILGFDAGGEVRGGGAGETTGG